MKKSLLLIISMLFLSLVLIGCSSDNKEKEVVETDKNTEEVKEKDTQENNEVEDNTLTKSEEELMEIGRNLITRADEIYIVKTEEEVNSIIDDVFYSKDFFTYVFMDILDPDTPYVKVERTTTNESVEKVDKNLYFYTATSEYKYILADGSVEEEEASTSKYHIVRTPEGEYRISDLE